MSSNKPKFATPAGWNMLAVGEIFKTGDFACRKDFDSFDKAFEILPSMSSGFTKALVHEDNINFYFHRANGTSANCIECGKDVLRSGSGFQLCDECREKIDHPAPEVPASPVTGPALISFEDAKFLAEKLGPQSAFHRLKAGEDQNPEPRNRCPRWSCGKEAYWKGEALITCTDNECANFEREIYDAFERARKGENGKA